MFEDKIIRIFPRRTNATPIDDNVVINRPPGLFDEAEKIDISVAFTYDLTIAENLFNQWRHVATTEIGGPALNKTEGEFVPGKYLKSGYVITSRGCPNRCWFCSVWKRQPVIKELQIKDGWNILDDNLLACSPGHIIKVFEMLKRQDHKPRFTGGLEAKLITKDIALKLKELKPESMYFAYDTPDDYEPLVNAGKILKDVGFGKSHDLMCYVLFGYKGDTLEKALQRMIEVIIAGFMPFAMRYRDKNGVYLTDRKYNLFQREWTRPEIVASNMKKIKGIK